MRKNKYFYLVTISSLVLLVDQATKFWIRANVPFRRNIEVIPGFFRLVHVENEGAAWGLLSDASYRIPFFIVATLVAFVVIAGYFRRLPEGQTLLAVAMASILGGAVGNFIDRLVYQSVTDFLDFYIDWAPVKMWLIDNVHSNRWPSFNVADVAIVVGLVLIMYDMLVLEARRAKLEGSSGQPLTVGSEVGGPAAGTDGVLRTGDGGRR